VLASSYARVDCRKDVMVGNGKIWNGPMLFAIFLKELEGQFPTQEHSGSPRKKGHCSILNMFVDKSMNHNT
jgi:hypothetical protein